MLLFAIMYSEGEARATPKEIKKMTFSEKMISKYGAARWEEMKKEANKHDKEDMVVIRGSDLLNHSVTALIMTGNSYDGELDKIAKKIK